MEDIYRNIGVVGRYLPGKKGGQRIIEDRLLRRKSRSSDQKGSLLCKSKIERGNRKGERIHQEQIAARDIRRTIKTGSYSFGFFMRARFIAERKEDRGLFGANCCFQRGSNTTQTQNTVYKTHNYTRTHLFLSRSSFVYTTPVPPHTNSSHLSCFSKRYILLLKERQMAKELLASFILLEAEAEVEEGEFV